MVNSRVYLDINIGNNVIGRITFELFHDTTPITSTNFKALCSGDKGFGYLGCKIFRVVKGAYWQSGDFEFNNGDGGKSIYGSTFNDESFSRNHSCAGLLSMANNGRNTNGSQFIVTLSRMPSLDKKHVVFGRVVDGMQIVRAIENVPVDNNFRPKVTVLISSSGILSFGHERGKTPLVEQRRLIDKMMREHLNPNEEEDISKGLYNKDKKTVETAASQGRVIAKEAIYDWVRSDKIGKGQDGDVSTPTNLLLDQNSQKNILEDDTSELIIREEEYDEFKNSSIPSELLQRLRKSAYLNDQEVLKEKKGEEVISKPQKEATSAESLSKEPAALLQTHYEHRNKKLKNASFGWNVFNQDSLYRANKKRIQETHFRSDDYQRQKAELGENFYNVDSLSSIDFKPSEEAVESVVDSYNRQIKKRSEFSRRRMWAQGAMDVTYISDRNRVFNEKLERSFSKHTKEIKQNLERGTAL